MEKMERMKMEAYNFEPEVRIRKEEYTRSSYEPASDADDNEIVARLVDRWTVASPKPPPQQRPTASYDSERYSGSLQRSQCDVVFSKGDLMYKCDTCAASDYKVFCRDCFNPSYHRGHEMEVKQSKDPGDYCDCGHQNSVKAPMICDIHGTTLPERKDRD